MTIDEAQAVHAAYQRPRKDRPPASEYMRYMLAKKVLAEAKLLTLTAGQRGFLEAARIPGDSSDLQCTRCGQAGHRASQRTWPAGEVAPAPAFSAEVAA